MTHSDAESARDCRPTRGAGNGPCGHRRATGRTADICLTSWHVKCYSSERLDIHFREPMTAILGISAIYRKCEVNPTSHAAGALTAYRLPHVKQCVWSHASGWSTTTSDERSAHVQNILGLSRSATIRIDLDTLRCSERLGPPRASTFVNKDSLSPRRKNIRWSVLARLCTCSYRAYKALLPSRSAPTSGQMV